MEFYGDSPQYVIPPSGGSVLKDFAARVDKIVAASIDRYMWGRGFQKVESLGCYEKTRNGGVGESKNYVRVTVPDASGKGGGLVTSYGNSFYSESTHNYSADFETIRNNILHEFKPVKSLPVIGEIEAVEAKLDRVRNDLTVNVTSSDDRATDVASKIETIQSLDKHILGGQYAELTGQVTNRIPKVVNAIGAVVACLLSVVRAEKEALITFRNDLGNAMDKLVEELNNHDSSVTLAEVFAVVGWAFEAATVVGTGGTSAIAKFAVNTVSSVCSISYSATKKDATASGIGWGIDAGPNAVRQLLVSRKAGGSVSAALFETEEQLAVFVNTTNGVVINDPRPYDLEPFVMQGKASGMAVERLDTVWSIADKSFPALTGILRGAAQTLAGATLSTALSRSWEVGRGISGAAPEYNQLNSFVIDALNALADELDEVADSLKKYVTDLDSTETESSAALRAVANDLHPKLPSVYSDALYSEKWHRQ